MTILSNEQGSLIAVLKNVVLCSPNRFFEKSFIYRTNRYRKETISCVYIKLKNYIGLVLIQKEHCIIQASTLTVFIRLSFSVSTVLIKI